MRFYTCITKDFAGDTAFFARDSGLLSRGFRAIGLDSSAVMPGEARQDDERDLIRTEYTNLESAEWWRSQDVDGVVLYSWGLPSFTQIAKAIRAAGIFLILNQDSSGVLFPVVCPVAGLRNQAKCYIIDSGPIRGWIKTIIWGIYRTTIGFARLEFGRVHHLSLGDVVSCVSPAAAMRYQIYLKRMGRAEVAGRVRVIPHPVADYFVVDPAVPKEPRVISIGRWDDQSQKRPHYLMEAISWTLQRLPTVHFDIVGPPTNQLLHWIQSLPEAHRLRVTLHGKLPNSTLVKLYQRASVLLCSSSHESFHIPAAEALCAGCSVVAPRLATLASFEWFCEDNPESLATQDTPRSLAVALLSELAAWENGGRNAGMISAKWCARLHSTNICRHILEIFRENQS